MKVCANGVVADFCKNHGMEIVEHYVGDIENYDGNCRVLVTDKELEKYEYYYLKGKLLAQGVELISTKSWSAEPKEEVESKRKGGRYMFGFHQTNGEVTLHDNGRVVVKRILELRDAGYTYREIQNDPGVHHPDGRMIGISTIQIILSNREKYEKEGL
jgi:hypothetical protein